MGDGSAVAVAVAAGAGVALAAAEGEADVVAEPPASWVGEAAAGVDLVESSPQAEDIVSIMAPRASPTTTIHRFKLNSFVGAQ